MKLFTWHDAEVQIYGKRDRWPESWNRVDVYHDEIVIEVHQDEQDYDKQESEAALNDIFEKKYCDGKITLDLNDAVLEVNYEFDPDGQKMQFERAPLFRDIYFAKNEPALSKASLDVPIVAFHSYKGGVGRTLSLISLAKEITARYKKNKKILIIDADIEAPGLTRLYENRTSISFMDILSIMHYEELNDNVAEQTAEFIRDNTIMIDDGEQNYEHYFLPVYREPAQITSFVSTPDKIIQVQNDRYVITDFLALVGKKLGIDMILIDLRAGVTEYSAPFLFDSRVFKYMISSTSKQSVEGTRSVLEELNKNMDDPFERVRVFLGMILPSMEESTIESIEGELVAPIDQVKGDEEKEKNDQYSMRSNYLSRVMFDSKVVHLWDFPQILQALQGTDAAAVMSELVGELFQNEDNEEMELSADDVNETVRKLNGIANNEITAEGNASSRLLSTESLKKIVRNSKDTVPQMVILGAKGSGKTYIYKSMLLAQTWNNFVRIVEPQKVSNNMDVPIIPLLTSQHLVGKIVNTIKESVREANKKLQDIIFEEDIANQNFRRIAQYMNKAGEQDWHSMWEEIICDSVSNQKFASLSEMDEYLEKRQKKLIFIIDGLEDLVNSDQQESQWKNVLKTLCQDVMNDLRYLHYGNIGLIVFARKDMTEEAIRKNYAQFENQYSDYMLKWSPAEALRLALWLTAQANPVFSDNIDILTATKDALEKKLEMLWGKKLGKSDSREANSARWIIAALSDFTGQLQARDIVRFLYYATKREGGGKLVYSDRYIMPSEIRNAIPQCSDEKMTEIRQEMQVIYNILMKLQQMNPVDKWLPLSLEKIDLKGEEIDRLMKQGYLTEVDDNYYFPEIIRHALGFRYVTGARPKVLSLLSKRW